MKILVVLTYYYPHWTGLTAHAVDVAEGLAARGHNVTVLTTRHKPNLARDEIINGVRVVRLQPVSRFSRGMITPALPYAAAKLISEHDIVQIHTPLPEASVIALLCRGLGRSLLMTHHGDVVMPKGLFNQFIQRAAYNVLRFAGQFAGAVTSYSRDYADNSRLLQNFTDKLTYIYPPVDIPAPDPVAAHTWKTDLGLENKLLIGFAGRWVEEKGFDDLLRALPIIRQTYPEAHLVYAGEQHVVYDNFYERCQPLIEAQQEHITFLGLIRDSQQMANFYAICDLFVLPSHTDMMALVQVESMLCGTPVVATDIPGARVVVQETGYGQLAPPHNPQGLAWIIIEILRNREQFHPDPTRVRQIFNTTRSLDQYERLMEQLAQQAEVRRKQEAGSKQQANGRPQTEDRGVQIRPHASRFTFHVSRFTHQAPSIKHYSSFLLHPSSLLATDAPPANGMRTYANLSPEDQATLERLLTNEADMAFRRRAKTLLDHLDLHDGETVLDCGCGMGVYLMMIGRLRDVQLFGVDGDVSRLNWAEREQVRARLASVDIHRLPFADNSFDKVLMSEVLEHLADDRASMREVYRVLKPGGVLALSVPHADYPFWWDPFNKTLEALDLPPMRGPGPIAGLWSNHWRLYRPADLRDVMTSAGFEIEELEEQTHYSFPFIHFIVYGIGKPLIEYNLLPAKLRNSADRFRGERNSGSLLNPINLGVRAFRRIDARNDDLRGDEGTFVNIVVRARKRG